jgi:hypothetical protein
MRISNKNYWEKRDNLSNKPSLSYKSIEVIQKVKADYKITLGEAIELLFTKKDLYGEILDKLEEHYPDIKEV